MEKNVNFKETAYKMLYENYKNLFERVRLEAKSKVDHGKDEDKIAFLSNVANPKKYSHYGLISKEDIKVVQALEKCLGEHMLVVE